MDAVLLGTASTLAGVIVAGVIAIVRDDRNAMRQNARDEAQRADQTARDEAQRADQTARDEARRMHEVAEARFDARREAYVGFAAVAHRGLYEEDFNVRELYEVCSQVEVIGPQEAAAAAYGVLIAFVEMEHPDPKTTADERLNNATREVLKFDSVVRRLLKFDAP